MAIKKNNEMINSNKLSLKGIDVGILITALALLAYGSVMVFSASAPYALAHKGDSLYYGKRQIVFALLGVAGMLFCAALPIEFHKKYTAKIGFAVAFALLVIVLFTPGAVKRWINIGSFSIQPSEVMKPMLILALAYYMEWASPRVKADGLYKPRGRLLARSRIADKKAFWCSSLYGVFIPSGALALVCLTVMLENHFSGTLIIFCIGASVIFAGGAMVRWFAGAASVVCSAVLAVLLGTDYASERIDIWLHPESFSVTDETWQITQGLIAVGSGGVFGTGLGKGLQKQLYVSAAHNDFIFSIVCEELGLVGAVLLILLFFAFVFRALSAAKRCDSLFSSLVCVGVGFHIALQAFLNMAVVTATVPNTGVTLPFFSYGGSALMVLLCESGILLSAAKRCVNCSGYDPRQNCYRVLARTASK